MKIKNTYIFKTGLITAFVLYFGILIFGVLTVCIEPLFFLLDILYRAPFSIYTGIMLGVPILISLAMILIGLFQKHPFSLANGLDNPTLFFLATSLLLSLFELGFITLYTLKSLNNSFLFLNGIPYTASFLLFFCPQVIHLAINVVLFILTSDDPYHRLSSEKIQKLITRYLTEEKVSSRFDVEFFKYEQVTAELLLEPILKKLESEDKKRLLIKNIAYKFPKMFWDDSKKIFEIVRDHTDMTIKDQQELYLSVIKNNAFSQYHKNFFELVNFYDKESSTTCPFLFNNVSEDLEKESDEAPSQQSQNKTITLTDAQNTVFKSSLGNSKLYSRQDFFDDDFLFFDTLPTENNIKKLSKLSKNKKEIIYNNLVNLNLDKYGNILFLSKIILHETAYENQPNLQQAFIKKLYNHKPSNSTSENDYKIFILKPLTKFYNKRFKNEYNLQVTRQDSRIIEDLIKRLKSDGKNEEVQELTEKKRKLRNLAEKHEYLRTSFESQLTQHHKKYHTLDLQQEQKILKDEEQTKDTFKQKLENYQNHCFDLYLDSFSKPYDITFWDLKNKMKNVCINKEQAERLKEIITSEAFICTFLTYNLNSFFMKTFLNVLRFLETKRDQNLFLKNYLYECSKKRRKSIRSFKSEKTLPNILLMVEENEPLSAAIIHAIKDEKMKKDFLNHTFYDSRFLLRKRLKKQEVGSYYSGSFKFVQLTDQEVWSAFPDPQATNDKKNYSRLKLLTQETENFKLVETIRTSCFLQKGLLKDLLCIVNVMKLSSFIKVKFSKLSPIGKILVGEDSKTSYETRDFIKGLDTALQNADKNLMSMIAQKICISPESIIKEPARATDIKRAIDLYQNYSTQFNSKKENRVEDIRLFGHYVDCKSKIFNYKSPIRIFQRS